MSLTKYITHKILSTKYITHKIFLTKYITHKYNNIY